MDSQFLAIRFILLLLSLSVHEFMHAYAAYRFGDSTAKNAGRMTLNPIPHIDLIGTVLVPLFFMILPNSNFIFGWAKPTPVNPLNFTNIRQGELVVSLAGVSANFVLALIGALLFHLNNIFLNGNLFFANSLIYLVGLNLALAVFNLIPIPPLDGSKVLISQLPYKYAREIERIAPYGIILFAALIYLNVFTFISAMIIYPLMSLLLQIS